MPLPLIYQTKSSDLTIKPDDSYTNNIIKINIPESLIGRRLDVALSEIIPDLSRNLLTNWLKSGQILVDGKILKPKEKVLGKEEVVIYPSFINISDTYIPEKITLNIIYEDSSIIVINKPAGLTVHPGNGNWSGTLLNGLLYYCESLKELPRAGIVHRLDKDTSGLMVVAKTLQAQTSLVKQLQDHTVSRIYRTVVEGNPEKTGTINKNMGRDNHNRTKMAVIQSGGKKAITHYRVLQYFNNFSYIECKLETGRTHQIRVHFKSINHPIIGDPVYNKNNNKYDSHINNAIKNLNRQALHALKLSFIHPQTNQIINFQTPLPDDISNLLSALCSDSFNNTIYIDSDDNYEWK